MDIDRFSLNSYDRSIVNGLRDDDDDESYYGNRASFVSEYSVRDEGVQVFFKEHGRTGSKDSQSSFLSRKSRKKATQGEKRPETKVRRIFNAE
jgi:serine/arginine repetitive matrix protein 2